MDVAVIVNLKARKSSARVVDKCREVLPQAQVLTSRSIDDVAAFTRGLAAGRGALLVSAGGDGTAVGIVNAMRTLPATPGDPVVSLAALPLGTGNGWAHATGAPPWRTALDRLGHLFRSARALPLRRFHLLEVRGALAHFAGTGWDAEIIEDFHRQKTGLGVLPRSMRGGLAGYLQGLITRTIPRTLLSDIPEAVVVNTGEHALGIDDAGRPYRLPGGEPGSVLYRGPASICAAGTSPEWGFHFRAFPFADLVPGRFNMRLFAGSSAEATMRARKLWTGVHPVSKMHSWLLTGCRVTFDRPVPFQAGGDRMGLEQVLDYRLAAEQVDLVDWPQTIAA
ncbi:MAG TPA: diacylglycerol kinase family protein [Kofleriaceae bacterium]|nr:diacylglycerol kinase family protein [Kofleriaceae bacterium]